MHNAGGYLDQRTRSPLGLGMAIAINGALIGALLLANPEIPREITTVFEGYDVREVKPKPVPPPPKPPETVTFTQPVRETFVTQTPPVVPIPPSDFTLGTTPPGPPPTIPGTGTIGQDAAVIPPRASIFTGSQIDPRYRAALQPPYPPGKQRLGEEGVVTVRVLVGPDGRVLKVERIDASDDAFFRATAEQASKRWRFKPATRDGVPVESWRTMTVRFEIEA